MQTAILKKIWFDHYSESVDQLIKLKYVKGLISAFNANIDAVKKITSNKIQDLINKLSTENKLSVEGEKIIKGKEDVLRGLIHCFSKGIAEEWLIENIETFNWMNDQIGYDKLQMGGQGGIVANIMAVCGVDPVYVHCASLPKEQAGLFVNLKNLLSIDRNGEITQAGKINREEDIPLIHFILEFDKGDTITFNGQEYTCPKSNRFIATYDPLNFKLHVDEQFVKRLSKPDIRFDHMILSGYQMLQENISNNIKGKNRIDRSLIIIEKLKENNTDAVIHFEVASTQDKVIRKYLVDKIAANVDSIGFNERELIDILEVIGEKELEKKCNDETSSINLFEGMLKVFKYTKCPRMQLHMFGLYITLQKKGFKISPEANKRGMQLAASVAASKAGTGCLNKKENLKWAFGKEVSHIGLNELQALQQFLSETFKNNKISETGIFENDEFEVIAVPTILIDKPVTLVGMGDTISSVSLVGAI